MNEPIINLKDIIGLDTDEIKHLRKDAEYDVGVLEERIMLLDATNKGHDIGYDMAAKRLANEHVRGLLANVLASGQADSAAIKEVRIDLDDLGKTPEVIINTPETFAELREIFGITGTGTIYVCDHYGRYDMLLDGEQRVDESYTNHITELRVSISKRIAKFIKEGK